ncbi:MAG: tRNA (adenosine(37)-N6)-threonylcarbamoyltransferase complex dimerization subunit type 1 TsaB [Pseudomonadota bacterium]|nr:tRNA (adenosine(37)-N6)-threonylcarbamoyltransferase complex dimerization subunit type 1 TsaB [Pseudomonadota bacterium]
MIVLGLDTALKSCAAAILREGRTAGDKFAPMEKGHAEHLAPMVAATLREAGVSARDLDRIGVVVGPGGFAGVRVGLAFARGLAIGAKTKVIGVTSLGALAAALPDNSLRAAVIDARRGQVYAALYDASLQVLLAPFVAEPKEALQQLVLAAAGQQVAAAGDGLTLLGSPPPEWRLELGRTAIDAKIVARLAETAPEPASPPAPLYLRPPDAAPAAASPFEGLFVDGPSV